MTKGVFSSHLGDGQEGQMGEVINSRLGWGRVWRKAGL